MAKCTIALTLAAAVLACFHPAVAASGGHGPSSYGKHAHVRAVGGLKAPAPVALGRARKIIPNGQPLAITLSPDGQYVAIYAYPAGIPPIVQGKEGVEVWDLRLSRLRMIRSFDKEAYRTLKWHPTLPLILISTSNLGYWVLHPFTGKAVSIDAGPPTEINWLGSSQSVFLFMKESLESPSVLSVLDTRTNRAKPISFPGYTPDPKDRYDYLGNLLDSGRADFAVEYVKDRRNVALGLFPKEDGRWRWKTGREITPESLGLAPAPKTTFRLVGWLLSRRLVFATIREASAKGGSVDLWTCERDGTQARKWMALPIDPPEESNLYPWWVAVSGNGRRVAYIKGFQVVVQDAPAR